MRRFDRWKVLWSVAMVSFFGGAFISVFAGDETGSAPSAESESASQRPAQGCLADSATLDDLRRQKRELESRQKELSERESELKLREQALEEQFQKLAEARDEIGKADVEKKKENEVKLAKLVETIEAMNPKAASALVASLEDGLAIQAMMRLSTTKLSKVMNLMDLNRSTKLSELLAGVTRARKSISTKGGEKNDGKSNEQTNHGPISEGASPRKEAEVAKR